MSCSNSINGDAKKILQETEKRLQQVVAFSTNLYYIQTLDNHFTYVSRQARDFFDCDPEEKLVQWKKFITDQPSNQKALQITQKAISTAKRQPPYQLECRGEKGRLIWVEVNETPILNKGKAIGIVGSLTDITHYKKVERKLRESEERYRSLYNETPAMLHSIDKKGQLISVSNRWLDTLGYTRAEVLGRKTTEFLTEESRRYAENMILPKFFKTGYCSDVPYQFIKKNGEIIDILLSATAEKDEDGHVLRSLAVMLDVTEKKKAELQIAEMNNALRARAKELQEANLGLEAFSYSISHDLRKPLTIINGYAQAIKEMYESDLNADCQNYFKLIIDGVQEMDELIDAVLKFSHLKRYEIRKEATDLTQIVDSVLAELRMSEPNRIVASKVAGGIMVNGDAKLLRVVMENLLGNAWKYTVKTKQAQIEFGKKENADGFPIYFVKDNGAGFDMAHAGDLFTPFARLPSSDEIIGYGIGLSIAERIISRHGGKIWAEAVPDEGAAFFFTL